MSVPQTRPSKGTFNNAKQPMDFKTQVYQTLAKFGDNSTLKYAQDEIREIMTENITDSERMNTFIHLISDVNEQLKPMQKKEHFRIFGLLGEIFGENIIPFMPKILQFYKKKFQDIDPSLSQALADSLGVLFHYMLKNLKNKEESVDQLKIVLRELHQNIISSIKLQQVTAALCLAKVIQNSPSEAIKKILPKLANRIAEEISNPNTKCKAQILECLISTVLSIEKEFQPYVKQFLPFIIECADSKDQDTKKMSIDVIYTIAAILPPTLAPFKDHLIEVLNESRFDKQKPIREATIEAISALKDLPPSKQERIARQDGAPDKKASREDPTPRPKEMPSEKFEVKADKQDEKGQATAAAGRQVTAVTQKKLMTARIMKSKSPVRKELVQKQDNSQKTSIFKGPVNKEFFTKVQTIENGIQIVTANEQEEDQSPQEDGSPKQEDGSPQNETMEQEKSPTYAQTLKKHQIQEIQEEEEYPRNNSSIVYNKAKESRNISRKESETNFQKPLYTQSFNNQESFKRSPSKDKIESAQGMYPESARRVSRGLQQQTQFTPYQPTISYQAPPSDYQQEGAEVGIDQHSFNNSLNYIFYELDKISTQQLRMMESMNSFQNFTRNEIDYLKSKISTLENSVDELLRTGASPYQEDTRQTFGRSMAQPPYYAAGANYTMNATTRDINQPWNDYTLGAPGSLSFRQNPNMSLQQSMMKPSPFLGTSTRDTFGGAGSANEWNRIQQLVNDHDFNEAYSQVLMRSKDETLLIKLMGKTGVCVNQLQKSVLDYLVQKIVDFINKRDFLNVIIVWVQELSNKLIEDQYFLNYNTTVSFIESLKRLSEDFAGGANVNSQVRQIAKQSHESLSQAFKFY